MCYQRLSNFVLQLASNFNVKMSIKHKGKKLSLNACYCFFEVDILVNKIETVDCYGDKSKWSEKSQYNKRKTRRGVNIYNGLTTL